MCSDSIYSRFTIENLAGGDRRNFRFVDGWISDRAIRHARTIGFGGPVFHGPGAEIASEQWEQIHQDILDGVQS